jgi:transposase
VSGFIEAILTADRQAPRKQRHTAHRIFTRLQQEHPEWPIAESTVRHYVRERKAALGVPARETFVPQQYELGGEAQVDWYEAEADLDGERQRLQVFVMRSMASGAAWHGAYLQATQQAFLEGHELAFSYFGGVFRRLRYDNLSAAVRRVVRGSRREETARFIAFRSHWRFSAEFCTPAQAHEKGGVEQEVGRFRRNHWVPVPQARDLVALNAGLNAACQADEVRTISGQRQSVGVMLRRERDHLAPLADEPFDLVEASFATVTSSGWVRVKTNAYSVPVSAGTRVQVKLSAATVEVWHEGRQVASHERCYGRHQEILDLEHYLAVLAHKPGALAGSKPLEQWRQAGRWPASYDHLWQALIGRQGHSAGTKAMIGLLRLGQTHGSAQLRTAIETALAAGCTDSAAVEHLLTSADLTRRPVAPVRVGALVAFERPAPTVDAYDQLLCPAGVAG